MDFILKKIIEMILKILFVDKILSHQILEQLSSLSSIEKFSHDNDEHRELIIQLSPHIRQWQERTHALFQQQKEKGGIINLEKNQEIIFS